MCVNICIKADVVLNFQPANRGGSMCGSKTLQVLQAVLDQHVIKTTGTGNTSALSDAFLTQGTPLRFPSLLSQFR